MYAGRRRRAGDGGREEGDPQPQCILSRPVAWNARWLGGYGTFPGEVLLPRYSGRVTGTRVYDNRGKEIDTYRLGVDNLGPGASRRS
jgi:hypothetical protein